MMKPSYIFLLFWLLSIHGFGYELRLPEYGSSLETIVPQSWRILAHTTGDLNQDGITDLVFAIQDTEADSLKVNDGLGIDTVDMNQRVMGIYFGTHSGIFKRQLISNSFIILRDSPTMDEPFEGFGISKSGVLSINFKFWYSAGSWYMSTHTYKFRFQNECFTLIGYESTESHRASGDTKDYSINFLTKKMKITRGNFSNDEPETVKWKQFILPELFTLKGLKKPFNLAFEDIYL